MRRFPLRWRVSLAFGVLGFGLCAAFAASTAWITERYEHLLISGIIEAQATHYRARLQADPQVALPASPRFAVLRPGQVPAQYLGLGPGIHEPNLPGQRGLHVGVFGDGEQRLYFLVDSGEIEAIEGYLALIGALIITAGTLASAWLGWLLAGISLRPLGRLAEQVRRLPERPSPSRLADGMAADELGELALAVDGYQQRLVEAERRSRAFFADASHELRTPITVVRGALEVIQDDPALGERQRQRLDRIDRGVAELAASLEAVLLVARGAPGKPESFDLVRRLDACRLRLAAERGDAVARIVPEAGATLPVHAAARPVDSLLSIICLRLLARPEPAVWAVRALADGLVFGDQGDGSAGTPRSDRGLGLLFAERLCLEIGWRLEEGEGVAGQPWVRLWTSGGAPAA